MNKKIVLSADGTTATTADATLTDIVTTLFETNSVLTGTYGMVQKAGLALSGYMVGNKRHTGNLFDFKTKVA